MPNCRHCGARIEKFHKDRCPICGELNPLDGVSSETIEITSQIQKSDIEYKKLKIKKKKTFCILSCLLGWTGAAFFYIKHKKPGFIWLIGNTLMIGLLFLLLFLFKTHIAICLGVSFGLVYLANIVFGISVLHHASSLKDGDGNLVR